MAKGKTKKDFVLECRKIMADATLSDQEKERRIKITAEGFIDLYWMIRKAQEAIEKKYTPTGKYVFCPECGWRGNEIPPELIDLWGENDKEVEKAVALLIREAMEELRRTAKTARRRRGCEK